MRKLDNYRLLVVEDEYMLADDLCRALIAEGADVIGPASTQAAAIRLLQEYDHFDGAVLDVNLHGRTDTTLADRLRERSIPFVFATGYGEASMPAVYADVPRWEKPYNAEELAAALPRLFEKP